MYKPLVSVIIPTKDRTEFLSRCIGRLMIQNTSNYKLEIIVIDSSENYSNRTGSYYHYWEPRFNEIQAINYGISVSKGEIIALLSDDDYYTNDTIFRAVRFLQKSPDFDAVCGDCIYIDKQGKLIGGGMQSARDMNELSNSARLRKKLHSSYACLVASSTFFGRRICFTPIAYGSKPLSRVSDCVFFYSLLQLGFKIGVVPEVFTYYTKHSQQGAAKYRSECRQQYHSFLKYSIGFRWYDFLFYHTIGKIVYLVKNKYCHSGMFLASVIERIFSKLLCH